MQPKHEGGHSRKQFQIDRLAFFSDAVIAIAITLMVLEIKIPPIPNKPWAALFKEFGPAAILHASALLICFGIIGNLWIKHHALFEHVIDYNKALIKRNLYFLLGIVILPVTVSFLFSEGSPMQVKLVFYFLNLSFINFTYYFMLRVIHHRRNNFSALDNRELILKDKRSTILGGVVFFVVAVLVTQNKEWFYLPFFVFPLWRLVQRGQKAYKKFKTSRAEKQERLAA